VGIEIVVPIYGTVCFQDRNPNGNGKHNYDLFGRLKFPCTKWNGETEQILMLAKNYYMKKIEYYKYV